MLTVGSVWVVSWLVATASLVDRHIHDHRAGPHLFDHGHGVGAVRLVSTAQ